MAKSKAKAVDPCPRLPGIKQRLKKRPRKHWAKGLSRRLALADYIHCDPAIMGGKPCIRGTRLDIKTILACLADGDSAKEIIADYPSLAPAALWAVIAYAAQRALQGEKE